jgi:hypothetical protein
VTADVYGSAQLFQKVWPRLLKANAIEAIAEYETTKKFEGPTAASCRKFMDEAEKYAAPTDKGGQDLVEQAAGRYARSTGEDAKHAKMPDSGKSLLFETADKEHGLLRRNILAR